VYRAYFVRAETPILPPPTPTLTAAPGQARVPDVVGMSVEDGRRVMESAGLRMEVIGQANHPSVPAFFIIEQRTRVGMPVAEGTTVGVVISQGPQLIEVPTLIGRSLGEAEAELQARALVPDTRQKWSEQPRGVVIEQDPPAGSPVKAGSVVQLVISSGTQAPVGARLGDNILLVAYELPRLTYRPGEALRISLTWQAMASPAAGYSVFVHLTRLDGSVVAQHDGLPAEGQYPTDRWSPGKQILDTHQLTIPVGTSQGEYWLRIGMYDQGGRLPIKDAGQGIAVDDALVLGTIRVE